MQFVYPSFRKKENKEDGRRLIAFWHVVSTKSPVCYENLSLRTKRARNNFMPTQEIGPTGVGQYSDDTWLQRVNLYSQKAAETQSIQQTMRSRKKRDTTA